LQSFAWTLQPDSAREKTSPRMELVQAIRRIAFIFGRNASHEIDPPLDQLTILSKSIPPHWIARMAQWSIVMTVKYFLKALH